MHQVRTIGLAVAVFTLCGATSASACYKHTFGKCDGSPQVAEATPSAVPQQAPKPSGKSAQSSGWVTTVTVSR